MVAVLLYVDCLFSRDSDLLVAHKQTNKTQEKKQQQDQTKFAQLYLQTNGGAAKFCAVLLFLCLRPTLLCVCLSLELTTFFSHFLCTLALSICLSVLPLSQCLSLSLSLSIDSHCLSSVSLFHPRLSGFFCSLALFPSLNLTGDPFFHHTLPISLPFLLVRWFEEPGPICELLAKASKIEVSEIKSPIGSICQKYVYSSFMVKMRIDLGPFGLFWFILGWG